MKTKAIRNGFQPVKLEIVLETEQELAMWQDMIKSSSVHEMFEYAEVEYGHDDAVKFLTKLSELK